MMLEAVRVLANMSAYSKNQLEDIADKFSNDWPIECKIPVGVLVRACREYENLSNPQDAVTSCARVVAAAEALVDYTGSKDTVYFLEMFLALEREVDNLRNYNRAAAPSGMV